MGVRPVHLARTIEDWWPDGSVMMFLLLARIQCRYLTLMSFISRSEWNLVGNCPASYLKDSRADVMNVEDKNEIT